MFRFSTKTMANVLSALGVEGTFLLVVPEHDEVTWKSVRNITGARMLAACDVNAYEVLRSRTLIVTERSLALLAEHVGQAPAPTGQNG